MKTDLILEAMKAKMTYDPMSGRFTWISPSGRGQVRPEVGTLNEKGYRIIRVAGRLYRAHRLAWLYVYGKWPKEQIDHINGKKDDNRIANLRDVSGHINQQNRGRNLNNIALAKGVTWHKHNNGWTAQIMRNGKNYYLGTYQTIPEASAAYQRALQEEPWNQS